MTLFLISLWESWHLHLGSSAVVQPFFACCQVVAVAVRPALVALIAPPRSAGSLPNNTMPVSCYICGRDFGTKSISIHIPNCIKKWEAQQKKLPKSERRPPPAAPRDLDKVISGELKGDELDKYNSAALEDWNKAALQPCEFCQR